MQNQGGANMLVTGAIFTGCPTSDVQMNPFGTGNVIHDVTFDTSLSTSEKTARRKLHQRWARRVRIRRSARLLHITNSVYFTTPNP